MMINRFLRVFYSPGEGGGEGSQTPPQANQTQEIDYERIGQMVNKRNEATEDSVLKSYFQKQGLSDEEMSQAISTFKSQKEQKAKEQETQLTTALTENQELKNRLVDVDVTKIALKSNVNPEKIDLLFRIIDRNGFVKSDGTTDSEAITKAVTKSLEDFPDLKGGATNGNGFQVIGGSSAGNNPDEAQQAQLSSIFGIKNKK